MWKYNCEPLWVHQTECPVKNISISYSLDKIKIFSRTLYKSYGSAAIVRKLVHYFRDINSINSHLISRENFSRAQLVVCSPLWQHTAGINTVKSKESFCMRRTMIISHFHILLFQYLSHVNMNNSCGTVALIQSSWKDFDLVQWIRNWNVFYRTFSESRRPVERAKSFLARLGVNWYYWYP
jgi:hypothetical protein